MWRGKRGANYIVYTLRVESSYFCCIILLYKSKDFWCGKMWAEYLLQERACI
jgi:hypothetical protein